MDFVPKRKTGKRFAIGDIHGCVKTLRTLLMDKIKLQKEDQLFLLGDYVHRGPDSEGVLSLILQLQKDGYDLHPLLGNHEVMYLGEKAGMLPQEHEKFLNELPHYLYTNDFYFVHAGFNFLNEDPLSDKISMIWGGIGEVDEEFLNGKKMVHGHNITSLSTIFAAIYDGLPVIPLDNGCYRALNGHQEGFGNLCGLDLDRMELVVQENLDKG